MSSPFDNYQMNPKSFPLENIQVLKEVESKYEESNFLIEDTETKIKYLQKINPHFINSDQDQEILLPKIMTKLISSRYLFTNNRNCICDPISSLPQHFYS